MRFALGSLVCSFALAGAVLGQELIDPVTTPGEYLEQASEAPAPPPVAIAPPDIDVVPAEAPPLTGEAEYPPTRAIQYEVAILHFVSSEGFTAEEQALSAESIDDAFFAWTAAGRLSKMSTFRLTSLDQQEASVQIGEQVPVVTARSAPNDRGGRTQAVAYQEVGALAVVNGRIDGAQIVVECRIEESRLEPMQSPAAASVPSPDAVEVPQRAEENWQPPTTRKLECQTTVTVPDGGKAVLSGAFQQTPEGATATIVTLKASILP
ncbi:MAG TPA: hypothetical protein VGN57_15410 [Pirellulaceae bacterium]|jgi:hypothetical protein|nr:hypothetical protein [Pirellulaceae bacterium]